MTCYRSLMLNNNDVLVKIAIEARDAAARNLEAACKRVRENTCAAFDDLYSDEMDQAFQAFELACDDLRETRDGYRHTFPHPVAMAPHGSRYPVR